LILENLLDDKKFSKRQRRSASDEKFMHFSSSFRSAHRSSAEEQAIASVALAILRAHHDQRGTRIEHVIDTVYVSKNAALQPHVDPQQLQTTFSVGDFTDGELYVETDSENPDTYASVKGRRVGFDKHTTHNRPTLIPHKAHAVAPFTGTRYGLVFYASSEDQFCSPAEQAIAERLGFNFDVSVVNNRNATVHPGEPNLQNLDTAVEFEDGTFASIHIPEPAPT